MRTFEVVDEAEAARIVCFATGQLNPETKDEIDVKCFNNESNKRKMAVTTELNGIEYSGQNFGPSNMFSTDNCDYYVAVKRKKNNKIQILPAELFCLSPKMQQLKDQPILPDLPKDTPCLSEEDERMRAIQKNHLLTTQFGSGSSLRVLKKSLDRKMDDGALDLMSQSVPATPKTSRPAPSSSAPESTTIPSHNKDAERPEDVYLQETIIPPIAMDHLKAQSAVFIQCTPDELAKWKQENTYPSVVLGLLEDLPLTSEERVLKCSLTMYLHCLMYLYNKKGGVLSADRYPSEWRGHVKKLLDDNFTLCSQDAKGRRRRTRPAPQKDLLLSHILILYMRLQNYKISFKQLIEDLKLKTSRLALHATTLGFKVSGTVDKIAQLKVPFKLPPPPRKKAK